MKYSQSINLKIKITGMPSLFHFSFHSSLSNDTLSNDTLSNDPIHDFNDYIKRGIKTYYTQLMLEEGIIASTSLYLSYAHTPELLQIYFNKIQKIFPKIKTLIDQLDKNLENQKEVFEKLLWGAVSTPKFGRLN